MNKGKTGVNTNTIIHIHRKPRKCNCRKCAYYHNGEEGKEYCSMNRKRLFPRKCSNYNKENVKMEITTFKSLGLQYLKHIKENGIITCKKCGEMIIQKSPKQKYCPQCARKIEKENHRERNKKWYKNKTK